MTRKVSFASLLLATLLGTSAASAQSLVIENAFHFLDARSANSAGIVTGVRQTYGAEVTPFAGTTGTATITGMAGTITTDLNPRPFDISPHFVDSRPANNTPNGAWTLTFTNSGTTPTTATALTPTIEGASVMGFASGMAMTSFGVTPTFSWTSATTPFDTQRVLIRDTTDLRGTGGSGGDGVANLIYSRDVGTSTTHAIDPAFLSQNLQTGRLYSFELLTRDLRDDAGSLGRANTLSQSRTFFDFMLLPASTTGNVFLPITDATNPQAPVFNFVNVPIVANQPIRIDPLVAVGYEYRTGAGDPLFASVTLPTGIGDNLYELMRWINDEWVHDSFLTGGVEHFFDSLGIDRFRILGIETDAGLDPFNPVAFITDLRFIGAGTFNGSMTPLTIDVPAVPGPMLGAGLPGLALAFGGLMLWWRRRLASAI